MDVAFDFSFGATRATLSPPTITDQPDSGAAPATLVVEATGSPVLLYQWYEKMTAYAISGTFSASDTTITLVDATGVNDGHILKAAGGEFMLVTDARTPPTIGVVRGYAGSTPETLSNAEAIQHYDDISGEDDKTFEADPGVDTTYIVRVSNAAGVKCSTRNG